MTTFESILLLAVTACVIITAFGVLVIKKMLKEIVENQYVNGETLSNIRGDTIDIIQELNNIEDNILDESVGLPAVCKKLDELRIVAPELRGILNDLAINSKGHYNELQQLREEIYNKRLLLGLEAKPFPPCYAPDGICTNPQRDCIGCPKHRSSGGTWSTNWSTNANLTKKQGNLD